MSHHDLVLLGDIALAFALCFVVGFERQLRGAPAGDRTYALVGTAAAAMAAVTVGPAPQAIGGVVTGVGFIGAGLVLRGSHGSVRGVTSAAAMFAATAIGVVAGIGHEVLAVAVAAIVVLDLELRYLPALRRLDASRYAGMVTAEVEPNEGDLPEPSI